MLAAMSADSVRLHLRLSTTLPPSYSKQSEEQSEESRLEVMAGGTGLQAPAARIFTDGHKLSDSVKSGLVSRDVPVFQLLVTHWMSFLACNSRRVAAGRIRTKQESYGSRHID